jgi:hypothetical protein
MRRNALIAAALVLVAGLALFESVTQVGRGWWRGEAFYRSRPTSYWEEDLPRWRPPIYC